MADVITLSSDEESGPPSKTARLHFLGNSVTLTPIKKRSKKKNKSEIVVVSDEEEDKTPDANASQRQAQRQEPIEIDDNDEADLLPANNEQNGEIKSLEDNEDDCEIVESSADPEPTGNNNNTNNEKENVSQNVPNTFDDNLMDVINGDKLDNSSIVTEDDDPNLIMQKTLLKNFLSTVQNIVKSTKYEETLNKKARILQKYFEAHIVKLGVVPHLIERLTENTKKAEQSVHDAILSFNSVFYFLKEVSNSGSVQVTKAERQRLKKLEHTIRKLTKLIHKLENTEVDFDDEENSAYLQLERFQMRLKLVYAKYCELLDRNPYSGRLTKSKLEFVDSEYNEINRAISKKYKDNSKFPNSYEMESLIRKVVEDEKLSLTEVQIKQESAQCFRKLGELLQTRRRKELYDAHYSYIQDTEDPANLDSQLDNILQENYIDGQNKIDRLCDEFVAQESVAKEKEKVESEHESDECSVESEESKDDNSKEKNDIDQEKMEITEETVKE